jgi:hypothetical protein
MAVLSVMDEFKRYTLVFGLGLAGLVVALGGTIYTALEQKKQASQEAQQVQALPADTTQTGSPAVPPVTQ